jgi:tripartite-type tricarboxylate transporter receptor subunit TctC
MSRGQRLCAVGKIFPGAAVLLGVLLTPCWGAEDPAKFPSKPITMVIQWAAGGTTDLSGRKIAEIAGKILGQPIVIENKIGGAGVIGVNAVAKAPADGYTIGTISASANTQVPHFRSVPYHPIDDFTFLMVYGKYAYVCCVLPDSPWKTFKDFIKDAQQNPGKYKYTTPGPLSAPHIVMEHIFKVEKVKASHIPVGGSSEAIRQLLGRHVDIATTPDFMPYIRSEKMRPLAVAENEKRFAAIPDVPTMGELGYRVELPNFLGICTPKGLDPRVEKKLFEAFKKASSDPSLQDLMEKLYLQMFFLDTPGFTALMKQEYENQGRVLRELGFVK